MKNLTSVDVANLLRNFALKEHFVNLNKTQVNKLLFMCYGFYLASTGRNFFLKLLRLGLMALFFQMSIKVTIFFLFRFI